MLTAKTIQQDCYGCPSSWSGILEDGRYWRVRYRWGILRFTVDDDVNKMSVFSKESSAILEEFQIGGEYDGIITFEDMREHLSGYIDLALGCDG